MHTDRESNCLGTLLDLICYERDGQRLSFEMEKLLLDHLRDCAACRRRVADFQRAAGSRELVRPH